MNLVLLRKEFSITLIPAILRHEYIFSREQAHADDRRFCEFIAARIIATQVDLLLMLAESGGVNSPNGGVNFEIENKSGGVNSMEQQIMETLGKMPGFNAPSLAKALGKSLLTIQLNLKILSKNGKIEFRGAPKTGGYFLMVTD
jgi:hypothetical protein